MPDDFGDRFIERFGDHGEATNEVIMDFMAGTKGEKIFSRQAVDVEDAIAIAATARWRNLSDEARQSAQASAEVATAKKSLSGPDMDSAFKDDQWPTVLAGDAIRAAIQRGEKRIAFPANGAMVKSIEGSPSAAPFYRSSFKKSLDKLAKQMKVGKPRFVQIDEGAPVTFKSDIEPGTDVEFAFSLREYMLSDRFSNIDVPEGAIVATPQGVFRAKVRTVQPSGRREGTDWQIAEDVTLEKASSIEEGVATVKGMDNDGRALLFDYLDSGNGQRGVWMIDIPAGAQDKFKYAALLVGGGGGSVGAAGVAGEGEEQSAVLKPRLRVRVAVKDQGEVSQIREVVTPIGPSILSKNPTPRARNAGTQINGRTFRASAGITKAIGGGHVIQSGSVPDEDTGFIQPRRRTRAKIDY